MRKIFAQRVFGAVGLALLVVSVPGVSVADEWVSVAPACKMWNPFPEWNETLVWNGKCKNGLAEGPGSVVEKDASAKINSVGYGSWTNGKLHGDYYYETNGLTCYEQKLYGVARQTLCVNEKGGAVVRAVDNVGRATEPMRPLTSEEKNMYKAVLDKIAKRSYVISAH